MALVFIGAVAHRILATGVPGARTASTFLLFFLTAPTEIILLAYVTALLLEAFLPNQYATYCVTFGGDPFKGKGPKWDDVAASAARRAQIALEQSRLGLGPVPKLPSPSAPAAAPSFGPHYTPVPAHVVDSMASASSKMGTFKNSKGQLVPGLHVHDSTAPEGPKTIFFSGPSGSFSVTNATTADIDVVSVRALEPVKEVARKIAADYGGIGSFLIGAATATAGVLYGTSGGNAVAANPKAAPSSGGPSSAGTAQHPASGQPSPAQDSKCELSDDGLLSGLIDGLLPEVLSSFSTVAPLIVLSARPLFYLYHSPLRYSSLSVFLSLPLRLKCPFSVFGSTGVLLLRLVSLTLSLAALWAVLCILFF